MIVAWMLVAPLGIMVARFGRTMFSWFSAHRAVQLFAFLLIFIGFISAIAAVQIESGRHFTFSHNQLGLAMFVLVLLQILLGAGAHALKSRTGKRFVGFAHIPLGLILFGEGEIVIRRTSSSLC